MRNRFDEQLSSLNKKLIEMGAMCEHMIVLVSKSILNGEVQKMKEVKIKGHEVDQMEREIETICLKLLLQQQPVASDLRQISAALKMITDMERIGDQAKNIAEIIPFLNGRTGAELSDFDQMAETVCKMVKNSIDAYVKQDIDLAQSVVICDDQIDDCFVRVKGRLIKMIANNTADGEYAIELLMIAKYFEKIGDHAVNIAEWVKFSVTGVHLGE
ncbi:MAG: phosphate signaling complex protein PhoU [Erysipelotrichaceae bacterium]|nr:phosphate signaling complex protein PhoU [Erysipelotrichaceae bacterium]